MRSSHAGFFVLALCLLGASPAAAQPDVDPALAAVLEQVSPTRLAATIEALAGFETRHTLSTQDAPTRGIGAAAQWIHDQFVAASPRLQVSFDTYDIPAQGARIARPVRLRNVMAVLPGRSPRRIYVSGHYDTVARVPETTAFDWSRGDTPAPGANDDGSGTALTLEAARVVAASGLEFDATIVFIAFAGEEQGLVGAHLHAQRVHDEAVPVAAVFNNDIVGNVESGQGVVDSETVRVFSEGPEDSTSRQLARFIARQAARYVPGHRVRLIARHDRFGRGGDHTAFNQRGFAGVRFTEANEHFGRQHLVADVPAGVDAAYLARNTRVNAAGVMVMAMAPPAPVVTSNSGRPTLERGDSGYDAHLKWQAAPGAVGYRVFWREAWTPDWQHERFVGDVTEMVLSGLSIDDYVFGVAAVGAGAHESVVSAYVNPERTPVTIATSPR